MNSITTILPIYLVMGVKKKTTFALNLNTYRNTHFQILNKAKVLFEETIAKRIAGYPAMKRVRLDYALFFGSNRAVDVANVCCIVDKFFCDTLVNSGKLPGDDRGIISNVAYSWGGVDPGNPRIEVTLSDIELSVEEPEPPMQISFTHSEIREALVEYLEKQITLAEGQHVEFEFDLSDPTDVIAYIDILRDGQKAKGMPVKSEPEKVVTNTPRAGESEKQTAARKTRGPNKPKAEAPAETAEEPEVEAKVDTPFDIDPPAEAAATKTVLVPGSAAPIQSAPAEAPAVEAAPEEEATIEAKVEAIKTGNSIFPQAGSSAAPTPTPAAPAGKSLFANLTRPTNAPTQH